MRELVIGDIHFGIKSNSVEWLTKQCKLLDTQVSEIIETKDISRVVFLGDVFDVRYSINQQVASEVKECIRKLAILCASKGIYIVFVAGNHDYYSPLEEAAKYNAYETVFGSEFTRVHPNVYFVTKDPMLKDDALFLPWYWTDNTDHFDELLYTYDFGREVSTVYCHADLSVWPGGRVASLKGVPVYAGHIHYIAHDNTCNLHNVGSCCALTFGDVNEDRYLYIIEDGKIVEKIANTCTPKFIRLFNDEIFNFKEGIFDNSFVQLCISRKNIELATYTDQIKYLKNTFVDANIRVHLIDDDEDTHNIDVVNISFTPNINDYIKINIPESLSDKFGILKEKYNNRAK